MDTRSMFVRFLQAQTRAMLELVNIGHAVASYDAPDFREFDTPVGTINRPSFLAGLAAVVETLAETRYIIARNIAGVHGMSEADVQAVLTAIGHEYGVDAEADDDAPQSIDIDIDALLDSLDIPLAADEDIPDAER